MIKLDVFQIGVAYAPRWVIHSNKGLYWNGEGWSPHSTDALLFHDHDEAQKQIDDLLIALFEAMTVWEYRATVELEVRGFVKPSLDSLKEHLCKNHSLDLYFDDSGPEMTFVLPIVKWDTLREARR